MEKLMSLNMLRKPTAIRCLWYKQARKDKFCKFYKDYNHGTKEYIPLKHWIEDLVQKESLSNYYKNMASMSNIMVKKENTVNVIYKIVSAVSK